MTSSDPTEAETRQRYIDKALERAGWHVADAKRVGQEIPVDGFDPKAWEARQSKIRGTREPGVDYEVALPAGVSDYLLYRDNGEVLAVVEAKRTSRDPRIAQAQTECYVAEIAKRQSFPPFAFMTNGHEIYFLDRSHANKRLVSGFFTEISRHRHLIYGRTLSMVGAGLASARVVQRATARVAPTTTNTDSFGCVQTWLMRHGRSQGNAPTESTRFEHTRFI